MIAVLGYMNSRQKLENRRSGSLVWNGFKEFDVVVLDRGDCVLYASLIMNSSHLLVLPA